MKRRLVWRQPVEPGRRSPSVDTLCRSGGCAVADTRGAPTRYGPTRAPGATAPEETNGEVAPMAAPEPGTLSVSYRPAAPGPELDVVALGELLRRASAAVPDRVALVDGQPDPARRRRWTYAEMLEQAEAIGRALAHRFEPGEKVAIWSANRPEWVLFQYGAALAGLVLVTVNPAYQLGELRYVLEQSGAAGVIHEAAYRGTSIRALVEELQPDLPGLRHTWCFEEWDALLDDGRSRPTSRCPPSILPASARSSTRRERRALRRGRCCITWAR